MNDVRSQPGRSKVRRRWAALATAAVMATGFVIGTATPSSAAAKASTSLSLTTIAHVATRTDKGAAVVAGDRADLKGTASRNLIGRTLKVQLKQGSTWAAYPGSGTVSSAKRFAIRIRVTGSGTQTFRVRYAGSSKLKPSSSSRSVKVWTWTRLVELPVASTDGSSVAAAAAHPQTDLVVAKTNRRSVLAGDVPAGGTGVATFDLGKRCRAFRTAVGITDGSPAAGSITFSVYLDDVSEVVRKPKRGTTSSIALGLSRVSQLTLRNTEPHPDDLFTGAVQAAWPDAQVLCDVPL